MYCLEYKNGSQKKSFENDAENNNDSVDVLAESSSSETSPGAIIPSLGDLTLEKDIDRKTVKQELYDLKLRIYYMEQRKKNFKDEDDNEIYQKYLDLQTDYEKLSKNVDEKDELLLKAQQVTSYLRVEKEKLLFEFQNKEKFYKEHVQQLEKELEDMKLCNPKFGLSSSIFMSGDSSDLLSFSENKEQKRINELERQISQLNMELESAKVNNDHADQTVHTLQRKVNLCNKEITQLSNDLITVQKERDVTAANCAKSNEMLNEMEKEKQKLESKLLKSEENNNNENAVSNSGDTNIFEEFQESTPNGTGKMDKAAATIIRHLLTENKLMNSRLRKLKDELRYIYEKCTDCPNCTKEKKLKKAASISLRQKSATSTSEEEKSESNNAKLIKKQSENENELNDNFVLKIMKEQEKQIKHLKTELKKRTYNLQELVNKELWDKNREIEKLNKICEKRRRELDIMKIHFPCDGRIAAVPNNAMRELQPSSFRNCNNNEEKENTSCISDDVKLLKEQLRFSLEEKKIMLDKIIVLENKIASDEEQAVQNSLIQNLRLECDKRKYDFEEAERARKEVVNACAMLTNRLEEIACFLEKLLANDFDSVSSKKRELLKQAIERSREISKSFTNTFIDLDNVSTLGTKFESSIDLSAPILPDYSEINLSFSGGDDDDDIHNTLQPLTDDNTNTVFNRIMSKPNEFDSTEDSDFYIAKRPVRVIHDLNASNELVFSSKGVLRLGEADTNIANSVTDELEIANEKCKQCTIMNSKLLSNSVTASSAIVSVDEAPKVRDYDSESETWSEPDRNVSAARIGLPNSCTKLHTRRIQSEKQLITDSDVSDKLVDNLICRKEKLELEVTEKIKKIMELEKLLKNSNYQSRQFEHEIDVLRNLMKTCQEKAQVEIMEKTSTIVELKELLRLSDDKSKSFEQEIDILKDTFKTYEKTTKEEITEKTAVITHLKESLKLSEDKIRGLENEVELVNVKLKTCQEKAKVEIEEKMKIITDLKELVTYSDEKIKKFDHETSILMNTLKICEEEKRDFQIKIDAHMGDYENLKKQHEEKMQHLLTQIITYRNEEESNLAAHRQLIEQVEDAQNKKEILKKSVQEWKEKYDDIRKQKENVEEKLQCSMAHKKDLQIMKEIRSNKVAEIDKEYKVHHLENIKSQLERRVKELETANKELELHLRHLQINKVFPSDFELTSEDSSRAPSPSKIFSREFQSSKPISDYSTYKRNTSTDYSSLPVSPNHIKRPASPLASSVPNSPISAKQNYSIPNEWLIVENSQREAVYENNAKNQLLITPPRKDSIENSATSPDLGIDSDYGRNSSFDFDTAHHESKVQKEIVVLEEENKTLKGELNQTKKELEETLAKLTVLNKNKKKMEKAIFKQIYETKHILKRARVNLEDESSNTNNVQS